MFCSGRFVKFSDALRYSKLRKLFALYMREYAQLSRLSSKPAVYRTVNVFDLRFVYLVSIEKFNEWSYDADISLSQQP